MSDVASPDAGPLLPDPLFPVVASLGGHVIHSPRVVWGHAEVFST